MDKTRADENLPEVVPHQPQPVSSLPEVVPDTSPEVGEQPYHFHHDKYPAYYDDAPKLPHEQQPAAAPGAGLQPQDQQWAGAGSAVVSAVSPDGSVPWQSFPPAGDDQQTYVASEPGQEPRICGIRRRLFIIIAVVLATVVIAAAVGGGVGGALSARRGSEGASEPAESGVGGSATPATSTSMSTTSSTSSTAIPSSTFLNNQTAQPQAFQGFSEDNYEGDYTDYIRAEGFHDLPFTVHSYVWNPNSTDYCVTFCYNKTKSAGWRCTLRSQPNADRPFRRISIWTNFRNNPQSTTICQAPTATPTGRGSDD